MVALGVAPNGLVLTTAGEVKIVGAPIESLPSLPRDVMSELLHRVELRPADKGALTR